MTLDQLYAAAQQHVLSRNNPTSPVDVANILLNYIAENGGSVDGTAINPSSIGATTPGTGKFIKIDLTGTAAPLLGFTTLASTDLSVYLAGNRNFAFSGSQFYCLASSPQVALLSDVAPALTMGASSDMVLTRDAAGVLAQRNGTNAQESRLYATYTSSTVYERLSSKYDSGSGAFVIGTEKGASGGSARPVRVQSDGKGFEVTTAGHTIPITGNTYNLGSSVSRWSEVWAQSGSFSGDVIANTNLIVGSGGSSVNFTNPAANVLLLETTTPGGFVTTQAKSFKTTPVLFADLPAAATIGDGARAFITDGASAYPANIGGTASGGGANPTPVMTIGGAWIYG